MYPNGDDTHDGMKCETIEVKTNPEAKGRQSHYVVRPFREILAHLFNCLKGEVQRGIETGLWAVLEMKNKGKMEGNEFSLDNIQNSERVRELI